MADPKTKGPISQTAHPSKVHFHTTHLPGRVKGGNTKEAEDWYMIGAKLAADAPSWFSNPELFARSPENRPRYAGQDPYVLHHDSTVAPHRTFAGAEMGYGAGDIAADVAGAAIPGLRYAAPLIAAPAGILGARLGARSDDPEAARSAEGIQAGKPEYVQHVNPYAPVRQALIGEGLVASGGPLGAAMMAGAPAVASLQRVPTLLSSEATDEERDQAVQALQAGAGQTAAAGTLGYGAAKGLQYANKGAAPFLRSATAPQAATWLGRVGERFAPSVVGNATTTKTLSGLGRATNALKGGLAGGYALGTAINTGAGVANDSINDEAANAELAKVDRLRQEAPWTHAAQQFVNAAAADPYTASKNTLGLALAKQVNPEYFANQARENRTAENYAPYYAQARQQVQSMFRPEDFGGDANQYVSTVEQMAQDAAKNRLAREAVQAKPTTSAYTKHIEPIQTKYPAVHQQLQALGDLVGGGNVWNPAGTGYAHQPFFENAIKRWNAPAPAPVTGTPAPPK